MITIWFGFDYLIGFDANSYQRPILLWEKPPYLNVDVFIKKKGCFCNPFWYEERQERRNDEPLVSLRKPGSAEQAQFFSVFRSNGGKREASARAGLVCERRSKK